MNVVSRIFLLCTLYVVSTNCIPLPDKEEPENEVKPDWPTYPTEVTKPPYTTEIPTWPPYTSEDPTWPPYTTMRPTYPTSWYPWDTTTRYPPWTTDWWTTYTRSWPTDPTRSTGPWWPTTTEPWWPTTQPWPPWTTTSPDENDNCYGHFIYKEEHNIIVNGEDDRHNSPEECEQACGVT